MKIARPSSKSSPRTLFAYHRPSRPKPRPKRSLAPIVDAMLASIIIGAIAAHFFSPAFLLNAGDFIWSIKSSLAELVLAVVAARVPKHH